MCLYYGSACAVIVSLRRVKECLPLLTFPLEGCVRMRRVLNSLFADVIRKSYSSVHWRVSCQSTTQQQGTALRQCALMLNTNWQRIGTEREHVNDYEYGASWCLLDLCQFTADVDLAHSTWRFRIFFQSLFSAPLHQPAFNSLHTDYGYGTYCFMRILERRLKEVSETVGKEASGNHVLASSEIMFFQIVLATGERTMPLSQVSVLGCARF